MVELNNCQQNALDQIKMFVDSDDNCFLLKGYAGTGKTFLTTFILDYVRSKGQAFKIMAPTGKAATIISNAIGDNATTIHSGIYLMSTIVRDDSVEPPKFYFKLKDGGKEKNKTIFIVDEASMISNNFSENKYFSFGSGKLLNDLIEYCNLKTNESKIIFIGDPAQLPPVGSSESVALDKEYLSKEFNLQVKEVFLDEIVRSASECLLENSTKLRKALVENNFSEFNLFADETTVFQTLNSDAFFDKYTKINPTINKNSVVICQTNKFVTVYNNKIRKFYFNETSNLTAGDLIVVCKNNRTQKGYPLMNGDFGEVISVDPNMEQRIVVYRNKQGQAVKNELRFRDVTLKFDKNKESLIVDCKILENYLDPLDKTNEDADLTALYIDFKNRNRGLKEDSNEFKEKLFEDPYYNALLIKYGYAVTCHKAQGGEWKNVFVDFKHFSNPLCEGYFRWAYTAITRSKNNLILFNNPEYEANSFLRISSKISLENYLRYYYGEGKYVDGVEVPLANVSSSTLIEDPFFRSLESILKPHFIRYEIQKREAFVIKCKFIAPEGDTAYIQFNQNAKGQVTSLTPLIKQSSSEKLLGFIQQLIVSEKSIIEQIIEQNENKYTEFKESALWSQDLSDKEIEGILKNKNSWELKEAGRFGSKLAIAKNIAGFMNSNGGKVLIGVKDNPTVAVGMQNEFFQLKNKSFNEDGYRRMIQDEIIKTCFPSIIKDNFDEYLNILFFSIKDKLVCVIDVKKSNTAIIIEYKKKQYFCKRSDTECSCKRVDISE